MAAAIAGTVLVLSSCQSPRYSHDSAPSPSTDEDLLLPEAEYIFGSATVESVTAEIVKHGHTQARLKISGLLNDGATTIYKIDKIKTADGFVITLTTARLKSAVAPLALVPFERIIDLDLSAVRSGPCQIRANELLTTIMVP
jgi:hypothetical protein